MRRLKLVIEPKLQSEICDLLAQGCTVRTCCEAVGLAESSYHRWSRLGDPESPEHDARFLEFRELTTRARGLGKAQLLRLVRKHAETDARTALELLARLSPDEYGKTYREPKREAEGELAVPAVTHVHITNSLWKKGDPALRYRTVDVAAGD